MHFKITYLFIVIIYIHTCVYSFVYCARKFYNSDCMINDYILPTSLRYLKYSTALLAGLFDVIFFYVYYLSVATAFMFIYILFLNYVTACV